MVRRTVVFPADLYKMLQIEAKRLGISINALVCLLSARGVGKITDHH